MSGLIGVRRGGETRIAFAQTRDTVRVGEGMMVETEDGSFAATVAIATDQLPERIPPMKVEGTASRFNGGSTEHDGQSREDQRYRTRKQRFPALGDRRPEGLVVRIDLRHESFDVRDDNGQITTVALQAESKRPT